MPDETMKAVEIDAEYDPKPGAELVERDIPGEKTHFTNGFWKGPEVDLVEKAVPEIDEDGHDILIDVKQVGICGSDLRQIDEDGEGWVEYPGLAGYPVTPGHEFVGIVEDIAGNEEQYDFDIGDLVVAEEMLWDGECYSCRTGHPNHCETLDEVGFSIDGAAAEYISLDGKFVWDAEPLRESYDDEDEMLRAGALVEPVTSSYHALFHRSEKMKPGRTVTVFGAGPIGMVSAMLSRTGGAGEVIVSEINDFRREFAEDMGFETIDPEEENVVDSIMEQTDGYGADVYVEATGNYEAVFPDASESVKRGRKINPDFVVLGRDSNVSELDVEPFIQRKANVIPSQGHSSHQIYPDAIRTVAYHDDMNLEELVTSEYDLLEDGADAYDEALNRRDRNMKVQLRNH